MTATHLNRQQRRVADREGAKAESTKPGIALVTIKGQLASGRPCAVSLPEDISDFELLSLVSGVIAIGDELRARRARARLVLPS